MLPSGGDLTLSELRELAARQQQQIQTQQQILVAKEQRLKFLKQQEMRHHQIASENERLRRLREKVEAQELKLKKLRAVRGQVDQHKSNNVNLKSELEAIRGLFNEKEKDLAVAVAKVDELTKQLEKIQIGNMPDNNNILNTPAAMELEKLRKELAMRSKINEQQNAKLSSSHQILALKKDEVAMMDKRITELQAGLQKKRTMLQEQHNNLDNQKRAMASGSVLHHRSQSSNIAAVEPYIKHVPKDVTKDNLFSRQDLKADFSLDKNNSKYQTLPYSIKSAMGDVDKKSKNGQVQNGNDNHPEKPVGYTNIHSGSKILSLNNELSQIQNKDVKTNLPANFNNSADNKVTVSAAREADQTFAPQDAQVKNRYGFTVKAPTCFANFAPRPFGSTYSTALITNRNNAVVTTTSNAQSTSSAVKLQGELNNGQVPISATATGKSLPSRLSMSSLATGKDETDLSVGTSTHQPLSVFTSGSVSVSGAVSSQTQTSSRGVPSVYKASIYSAALIERQQTEAPKLPPQSPNDNVPNRVTVTQPTGPNTSTPVTEMLKANTFVDTPASIYTDNCSDSGQFSVTNSVKDSLSERQKLEAESATEPLQTVVSAAKCELKNAPVIVTSSSSTDPCPQSDALDTSPRPQKGALDTAPRPQKDARDMSLRPQSDALDTSPRPQKGVLDTAPRPQKDARDMSLSPQKDVLDISPHPQKDASDTSPHPEKGVLDTSPNAVSSALSVLMGSNTSTSSTTTTTTSRPAYRYSPKTVITNTYMRKLGSSAGDQYRKNMAALYKDFYPHGDTVSNAEIASPTGDTSHPEPGDTSFPKSSHNTPINSLSPVKHENHHSQTIDSQVTENKGRPKAEPQLYSGITRGVSPQKTAPPSYPSYGTSGPLRPEQQKLSTDEEELNSQSEPSSELSIPQSLQGDTQSGALGSSHQEKSSRDEDVKSAAVAMRMKKPTLKSKDLVKRVARRVKFDPLALLLDASLEGELELVKRTAAEVPDPSAANDEGITALHNAICAGHYDIFRFLVEFGCDVNAPDSDGWTPLHCASSCNNMPMVKFLVENGACIFATTISDQETAADKCEEDGDGFDGCSEYLYSVQEKLGILNSGLVFALFDYSAQNSDELEFCINDQLTVLRKGDDQEREWWWTRHRDREGYIPRNLLGLYPRVLPKKEKS